MGNNNCRSATFNRVLYSLCTATNATHHERFFACLRSSSSGTLLPSCMTYPGTNAHLRHFVQNNKNEPLVDEVETICESEPSQCTPSEWTQSHRLIAKVGPSFLRRKAKR